MKRSSFLTAGAALAAAAPHLAAAAQAVPGGVHLVERHADFDAAAFAKAVDRPSDVRQLWEAVSFHPLVLANVKNSLNGLHFGFGYPADRIAMVFAGHGPSSAYTYSDYVWKKYRIGAALKLKDTAGKPVTSNVFLAPDHALDASADPDDERSMWQDTSVQTLQKRGVVFLTCHTAVEEQSRMLVKSGFAPAGMTPSAVADDILTHLIAGTHVVPSMVSAVAVLQQKYHYVYTTVTFA